MPPVSAHKTATVDIPWNGPENKVNTRSGETETYYRKIFAWQDPDKDAITKGAWRFIHHEVAADGTPGAANTVGCSTGIGVLNGGMGGTTIPDGDRQGVYDHLAKHIRDAGKEPPPLNKRANNSRGYEIRAQAQDAEIWIYEEIGESWMGGGFTAKTFAEDLKNLGKVKNINLHLNSPGGVVWDGIAIYNLLKQCQARVTVNIEGLAASIASVIAMAGDEVIMAENALMMIHNPWGMTIGNAGDHRQAADMLDKIGDSIIMAYLDKQKKVMPPDQMMPQKEKMAAMMDAETWMSAQEAMDHCLVDSICGPMEMAASFDLSKFKYRKTPEIFKPQNTDIRQKLARQSMICQRIKAASGSQ